MVGQLIKNKNLQHIIFWGFSFLILLNILKVSADVKRIDLIYAAIFHLPILLIVYLNLQILFPRFLEKGKYFWYGITVLFLIAFGAGFYILLFDKWIDYIFQDYYFIAYYGFWDISLYLVIYVSLTSLLRLARGWFRLQEMEKEASLAELKALRSQINPHFLFNSLNSIYSLARKNSPMVPEKVLQLSDLMRHIIYESDGEQVLLDKEVEMIKNYIELQNLRSSDENKIELTIIGETSSKRIAPLIFLPFVENSFKHGLKGGGANSPVKIKIDASGPTLYFETENNIGSKQDVVDNKFKGIGIENAKKRLELIYPGQHSLVVSENKNTFKVALLVQLK